MLPTGQRSSVLVYQLGHILLHCSTLYEHRRVVWRKRDWGDFCRRGWQWLYRLHHHGAGCFDSVWKHVNCRILQMGDGMTVAGANDAVCDLTTILKQCWERDQTRPTKVGYRSSTTVNIYWGTYLMTTEVYPSHVSSNSPSSIRHFPRPLGAPTNLEVICRLLSTISIQRIPTQYSCVGRALRS